MTQQRLIIGQQEKAELRRKMLIFFNQSEGAKSRNMAKSIAFDGFNPAAIRLMLYGLDSAGLLKKVNIKGTNGARYQTTRLGRAMLMIDAPPEREDEREIELA